jgi:phage terminase large subunit
VSSLTRNKPKPTHRLAGARKRSPEARARKREKDRAKFEIAKQRRKAQRAGQLAPFDRDALIKESVESTIGVIEIQTARVFAPLLEPKRYKGAHGGRGSGKSHFFAEMLIERCVLDPTTRAVCIREVQVTLSQSVKRLIEDKIIELKVQGRFRVLVSHIEVLDDQQRERGRIIFMGMQNHTADSIKSLEGYDIAWVEEAQNLSERSFSLLRPTIRKPKSEIWCSWNPDSPKDPVDSFFRGAPNPDVACVEANYEDNPWFPDVLRADMEYDKRRDPDRWAHVWGGGYAKLTQARVFRNWTIGDEDTFKTRAFLSLMPRYGADWGFAVDPTVGIKLRIDEPNKKLYIEAETYQIGCEIDDTPRLLDELDHGAVRKWPIVADSARPETISYMRRNGFPQMRSAKKGKGSIVEGVEFIKKYDVVIHPSCAHTIEEFTYSSYKIDPHTQQVVPILEDKKNHVIDAVRYAVEAVRHSTKAGVLF